METLTAIGITGIVLFVLYLTGNLRFGGDFDSEALAESGVEFGWMKLNKWTLIQTPNGYGRFASVKRNNGGTYDIRLDTEDGDAWVRNVDPLMDLTPIVGESIFSYLSGQGVYMIPITIDMGGGSTKVPMSEFMGIPDVNIGLAVENERLRQRFTNSQNFSSNPFDGLQTWETLKNEAQQLSSINKSLTAPGTEREEVRVQRPPIEFSIDEDEG